MKAEVLHFSGKGYNFAVSIGQEFIEKVTTSK